MAKMFDPHWNKGDKRVSQFFEKQASKEQDAPPAAPKAASESLLLTHVCDRESTGYKGGAAVKTADGLRRNEKTTFSPTLGMGHPPPRPPANTPKVAVPVTVHPSPLACTSQPETHNTGPVVSGAQRTPAQNEQNKREAIRRALARTLQTETKP